MIILAIVSILVLYLIVILISFSADNICQLKISSYVQVHNLGGKIGAYLAKTLLVYFGIIAYIIPFKILFYSYFIFLNRYKINLLTITFKFICYLILLFTSCSLVTLYIKNLYNFPSGGLIGYFFSSTLLHWFDKIQTTKLLLISLIISILLIVDNLLKNIIKKITNLLILLTKLIVSRIIYICNKNLSKKKLDNKKLNKAKKLHCINHITKYPLTINRKKYLIINANSNQSTSEQHNSINKKIAKIDNYFNKSSIKLPTIDLLTNNLKDKPKTDISLLEQTASLIENCLASYHIQVKVVGIFSGPVITRFELDLAPGVKVSRISSLVLDLARALSTNKVHLVEIIPGKPYVGLDIANKQRQIISVREVFNSEQFRNVTSPLSLALGKNIIGNTVIVNLIDMPHLLVAGTTGSGKSVAINAMILSMLYKATPKEVRFIMIDPKMLELSIYQDIPHLLTDVITNMNNVANVLNWCIGEMERRYQLMSTIGVRNLTNYNKYLQAKKLSKYTKINTTEILPYIVIIIDELADLMMIMGKNIEELIIRLAQKARASGIHLVLATQRPSVDVITGLIKANIPTRIAFAVSSKIDSRTILDQSGAESLLGMGDMLYLASNSSLPIRVHGVFVQDEEIYAVVNYWKKIANNS